ncbi:hypothetical protein DSO57_1021170 [Entomophthora muscae]|uniref:Uncharacterized protein n=1 Tax=Entomophthora muscae TaxID=34485 RepID=A0ACC2TR73_9FUNG|nr:hypothetical protein DSO57_1021170 [Entomophthora muscae]
MRGLTLLSTWLPRKSRLCYVGTRHLHNLKDDPKMEPFFPIKEIVGIDETKSSLNQLQLYANEINSNSAGNCATINCVTEHIKQVTLDTFGPKMFNQMISKTLGKYLSSLIYSIKPKRVLELGTFTGYSTQWLLFGMSPENYGITLSSPIQRYSDNAPSQIQTQLPNIVEHHLITCSIDESSLKIASHYLHLTKPPPLTASPLLMDGMKLINQLPYDAGFDFIFLDCNKSAYKELYDTIISNKLLSKRGMLVVDNVLFHGQVAALNSSSNPTESKSNIAKRLHAFNLHVAQDPRSSAILLPIFDGLMIIQRAE